MGNDMYVYVGVYEDIYFWKAIKIDLVWIVNLFRIVPTKKKKHKQETALGLS